MTGPEITSMFKAAFQTPHGRKVLTHLLKTFVDRPMYKAGLTPDEVAYRQGEADVIRQILAEVNKNG